MVIPLDPLNQRLFNLADHFHLFAAADAGSEERVTNELD